MKNPSGKDVFGVHPEWGKFKFGGIQGCPLAESDVVIVGKDANWPVLLQGVNFTQHEFFTDEVRPFLDGYRDWLSTKRNMRYAYQRKHSEIPIHHPLLLPWQDDRWANLKDEMPKGGKRYHDAVRRFLIHLNAANIEAATRVCFFELLPVATQGCSGLSREYFRLLMEHAERHISSVLVPAISEAKRRRIVFLALGPETTFKKMERDATLKGLFRHLVFRHGYPRKDQPIVQVGSSFSACEVWATGHISGNSRLVNLMAAKAVDFLTKS